MPGATVDLSGLVNTEALFARAAALDFGPLMKDAEGILREDNTRGLLAGLDCDDKPMPPTQRELNLARVELHHEVLKGKFKDAKAIAREKRSSNPLEKSFKGMNPFEREAFRLSQQVQRHTKGYPLANGKRRRGSLQAAHDAGSGPPLVPHLEASHAIANADTDSGRTGPETYEAVLFWLNFTTVKDGRSILPFHAHPGPTAGYPRRDVVSFPRPTAVLKFDRLLGQWFRRQILPGAP